MAIRKNIGMPDRVARVVVGVIALSIVPLAFFGPKTPLAFFGILGIFPIAAGILGYCPPYKLLGINTYHEEETGSQSQGGVQCTANHISG